MKAPLPDRIGAWVLTAEAALAWPLSLYAATGRGWWVILIAPVVMTEVMLMFRLGIREQYGVRS